MEPMQRVNAVDSSHYLLQIRLLRDKVPSFSSYPFCLPAVRKLEVVEPHPAVTFILGDNGAGKSTLLEAIAVAWGFNAEGGSRNFRFATHATHSPLHRYLRLSKHFRRPRDGYFFRAESYYNLGTEIDRLDEDPMGGPPIIDSYGRRSLHRRSTGSRFLRSSLIASAERGFTFWMNPRRRSPPIANSPFWHACTRWFRIAHNSSLPRTPRS